MAPAVDESYTIQREILAKALFATVDAEHNVDVLQWFHAAFEYRKQFEWLEESGRMSGKPNGLACALRNAIVSYGHGKYDGADQVGRLSGDSRFIRDLYESVQILVDNPKRVQEAAHMLTESDEHFDTLSLNVLVNRLTMALETYCSRAKCGTAPDPF